MSRRDIATHKLGSHQSTNEARQDSPSRAHRNKSGEDDSDEEDHGTSLPLMRRSHDHSFDNLLTARSSFLKRRLSETLGEERATTKKSRISPLPPTGTYYDLGLFLAEHFRNQGRYSCQEPILPSSNPLETSISPGESFHWILQNQPLLVNDSRCCERSMEDAMQLNPLQPMVVIQLQQKGDGSSSSFTVIHANAMAYKVLNCRWFCELLPALSRNIQADLTTWAIYRVRPTEPSVDRTGSKKDCSYFLLEGALVSSQEDTSTRGHIIVG